MPKPWTLFACAGALAIANPAQAQEPAIQYPATQTVDQRDTFFGTEVADPYRWLENDVRNDPRVKAWVDAQNRITQSYLAGLPQRDAIEARLKELWDYEKFNVPRKEGDRLFFERNSGLQNQFVLYVQDGVKGEPRLLLDPNSWSKDGATALAQWEPGPDGRRLAYAIQDGGSDWRTVRVLDVNTSQPLADELKWVKFSDLAWAKDGSGFYYSRFPEPKTGEEFQSLNTNQAVYFHRLGTPQSADRLVYSTPDRPKLGHTAQVSDDGRWLVVTTHEGTDDRYEISVADLSQPNPRPSVLFEGLKHSWSLAGSQGGRLYFVTNRDAPRYRLVSVAPVEGEASLAEVIPQGEATLESASLVGDRLLANYLEDAKSVVRSYPLEGGEPRELALPGIGSVVGLEGEAGDPETYYAFTSFNVPTTIYRHNTATGRSEVFRAPQVPFDPSQYEVRQTFYRSKDGTRVPMFLVHRRGLELDGGAPTLLYGYGGFNIPVTPAFSISRLAWMEMGGVLAVANLRGGGEYGKAWHEAGRLLNKQNVFDDFIAAGEYLVREGVTTPEKLAIQGGSNGGLLVGAVVNQRPDLFAAAMPAVGVMDMLRYNQFTAGRYWVDDYGDPAQEQHFRNLRTFSPYHNIADDGEYPAVLVTTADTDDRVVPGHSFKYAAALQAAELDGGPHLIRIETRAGHGSGKPTEKIIEEAADLWAFAGYHTGLTTRGEGAAAGGR